MCVQYGEEFYYYRQEFAVAEAVHLAHPAQHSLVHLQLGPHVQSAPLHPWQTQGQQLPPQPLAHLQLAPQLQLAGREGGRGGGSWLIRAVRRKSFHNEVSLGCKG